MERKGFYLAYKLQFIFETNQDKSSSRNLEVGTEAETLGECCLLVGLGAHIWLPLFTQPTSIIRDGTTHSRLGPPIVVNNQENAPCP